MPVSFDPYHRWLSIPPSEQPAHHYRLLGLQAFESDLAAIESAAERQMIHVRSYLDTPMQPHAANLIRELGVARHCLLDREAKAAYDAWLKSLVQAVPAPHLPTARPPTIDDIRKDISEIVRETNSVRVSNAEALPTIQAVPSIVALRRRRKKRSAAGWLLLAFQWLLGGVMGLLAGYAVISMIDPDNEILIFGRPEAREAPHTPRNPSPEPIPRRNPVPRVPRERPEEPPRSQRSPREPEANGPNQQGPMPGRPLPMPERNAPAPAFLQNLPKQVDLPPLLPARQFNTLAVLPDVDPKSLELTLATVGGKRLGSLEISKSDDADAKGVRWHVEWVPLGGVSPDAGPKQKSAVGIFYVGEDQLRFAWVAYVDEAAETALRNSVLGLRVGEHSTYVALRTLVSLNSLTLNLKNPIGRAPCKCDHLPDLNEIRVDLVDLVGFPPYRLEGAGLKGLKIGDVTTIWYTGIKGVATRITIRRRGRLIEIEVETRYRLTSGDEEGMSFNLGNRKIKQLRDRLEQAHEAKAQIPALEKYKKSTLPTKLTRAQNMRTGGQVPGGGYVESPQLALQKKLLIEEIQADAQRTEQNLSNAREMVAAIPSIESDLAAIAKVSDLAKQLHEIASIHYRFYFLADGVEVDLAASASKAP